MKKPDLNKPAFEIFKNEKELIKKGICPFCKTKIKEKDFKCIHSKKEYYISGLCQECQDLIFTEC
jgi:hypothetical protein